MHRLCPKFSKPSLIITCHTKSRSDCYQVSLWLILALERPRSLYYSIVPHFCSRIILFHRGWSCSYLIPIKRRNFSIFNFLFYPLLSYSSSGIKIGIPMRFLFPACGIVVLYYSVLIDDFSQFLLICLSFSQHHAFVRFLINRQCFVLVFINNDSFSYVYSTLSIQLLYVGNFVFHDITS